MRTDQPIRYISYATDSFDRRAKMRPCTEKRVACIPYHRTHWVGKRQSNSPFCPALRLHLNRIFEALEREPLWPIRCCGLTGKWIEPEEIIKKIPRTFSTMMPQDKFCGNDVLVESMENSDEFPTRSTSPWKNKGFSTFPQNRGRLIFS